jgi:hypothetical protein
MSCFVVVGMLMVKDLIAEGKQSRERREPFFFFFPFGVWFGDGRVEAVERTYFKGHPHGPTSGVDAMTCWLIMTCINKLWVFFLF